MLLINTKQNQRILVGETSSITILSIDPEYNEVEVSIEVNGDYSLDVLKTGVTTQILPNVSVTITRIVKGNENQAAVGFDAPRSIKIRGEWMRSKAKDLTLLSDKELITYSKRHAMTVLEKLLTERLEANAHQ